MDDPTPRTPTADERKAWLENRQRLCGLMPESNPDDSPQPPMRGGDGTGGLSGAIDALAQAFGDPVLVVLSRPPAKGLRVTVDAPTMGGVREFIASLRAIKVGDAPALPTDAQGLRQALDVLPGLMRLFASALDFEPGQRPADVAEWFDALRAPDGLALVEAFAATCNLSELSRRMSRLSGNVREVAGAARR